MALTVQPSQLHELSDLPGAQFQTVAFKGDTSYPYGGYTVPVTQTGLSAKIIGVVFGPLSSIQTGGKLAAWDPVAQTLRLFTASGSSWVEAVSGTDFSANTFLGVAVGY